MNCSHCEIGLIRSLDWRAMTPEQRSASGKKQRHGKFCTSCYHRARRFGTPARRTWKLETLLEEAEFLFEGGTAPQQAAQRLGIKHSTLVDAYYRARNRGLTTRRIK